MPDHCVRDVPDRSPQLAHDLWVEPDVLVTRCENNEKQSSDREFPCAGRTSALPESPARAPTRNSPEACCVGEAGWRLTRGLNRNHNPLLKPELAELTLAPQVLWRNECYPTGRGALASAAHAAKVAERSSLRQGLTTPLPRL